MFEHIIEYIHNKYIQLNIIEYVIEYIEFE